jgi:hypothetical protein
MGLRSQLGHDTVCMYILQRLRKVYAAVTETTQLLISISLVKEEVGKLRYGPLKQPEQAFLLAKILATYYL